MIGFFYKTLDLVLALASFFQRDNATGKEILSQVIEKIGYSKIKSAKAELAQTNKEAFDNAYKKIRKFDRCC